jgi:hypothetical protein
MARSSVAVSLLVVGLLLQAHAGPITYTNGGYEGVVVSIADNVPAHDCRNILAKLEVNFIPPNIGTRDIGKRN